jgi:hypothetical protein
MKLAIHNEQVPLLLHVWQLLTRQTQVDPFCTWPLGQIQVWFVSTKGAKQCGYHEIVLASSTNIT